jgi:hypothetical protein
MFHAIVPFFNFVGWESTVRNYVQGIRVLEAQNIPHTVIEAALEGEEFSLPELPHELRTHVRVTTKSVLWQKERLINHAASLLPKEVGYIGILDSGILLPQGWEERAMEALRRATIVQPFSSIHYLNKQGMIQHTRLGRYFSWNVNRVDGDSCPGMAWVTTRNFFEKVGFYDRAIVGSGDAFLFKGLLGRKISTGCLALDNDITAHCKKIPWGGIGYSSGTVMHLWHGDRKNRFYNGRHKILSEALYDPRKDVKVGANGTLEFATDKPKLRHDIRNYFMARDEDFAG